MRVRKNNVGGKICLAKAGSGSGLTDYMSYAWIKKKKEILLRFRVGMKRWSLPYISFAWDKPEHDHL